MQMTPETIPTQVAHSTRAAFRTFVQALPPLVGLTLLLPAILEALGSMEVLPAGFRLWATAAAVTVSALIAGVTKLMNLPGVDAWIEKYASALATGAAYVPRHSTV